MRNIFEDADQLRATNIKRAIEMSTASVDEQARELKFKDYPKMLKDKFHAQERCTAFSDKGRNFAGQLIDKVWISTPEFMMDGEVLMEYLLPRYHRTARTVLMQIAWETCGYQSEYVLALCRQLPSDPSTVPEIANIPGLWCWASDIENAMEKFHRPVPTWDELA